MRSRWASAQVHTPQKASLRLWPMSVRRYSTFGGMTGWTVRTTRPSRSIWRRVWVSQKMLTQTLRGLERDGLVTRTVYAEVPPRVEYALTDLGRSLFDVVGGLVDWAVGHIDDVQAAQQGYDAR